MHHASVKGVTVPHTMIVSGSVEARKPFPSVWDELEHGNVLISTMRDYTVADDYLEVVIASFKVLEMCCSIIAFLPHFTRSSHSLDLPALSLFLAKSSISFSSFIT